MPRLAPGAYTVRGRLIYDLKRYNDPKFTGDQTEIYRAVLAVTIVNDRRRSDAQLTATLGSLPSFFAGAYDDARSSQGGHRA